MCKAKENLLMGWTVNQGMTCVRGFVFLLLSLLLASCSDDLTPPTEADPPTEASQLPTASVSGLGLQDPATQEFFPGERDFVEIASRQPSFAGGFLEGGVLVVNVSDLSTAPGVAGAVQQRLLPEIQRRGRALGGMETREVPFTFMQLANWRNLAFRQVMSLREVTSLDLDEQGNRLRIGLVTEAGSGQVSELLESLGIPSEAISISVVGPAEPAVLVPNMPPVAPLPETGTLSDRFRPIPGGVFFNFAQAGDNPFTCTLGFNVRRWPTGTTHFITNSHCTYDLFDEDSGLTTAFQMIPPDTVGSESDDPDGWTCGWPWDRRICRYSDAAAYAFRQSVLDSVGFGTIARPEGPPGTSNTGPTTIGSSNPRFYITGTVRWPVQGDSVHKVGISGGWTKGRVHSTCEAVNMAGSSGIPEYRVLCAYEADYYTTAGDSGGPVFYRSGSTNALLAGVNFGRDDDYEGIFSSLGAIFSSDALLSQQFQVWNAPLTGSINGPLEAPPEEACEWSASNVSGGAWPYSYQWSGALTGTGMNVTGTIQAPGEWLYLTVTDALSNQLNDQIFIPVEEEMEGCEY